MPSRFSYTIKEMRKLVRDPEVLLDSLEEKDRETVLGNAINGARNTVGNALEKTGSVISADKA